MADDALTYGQYLKVPELLSLQVCLSSPPHHDETLFIIIHQVYELWFRLLLHEVDSAVSHLEADRVEEATRLLRRVVEVQRLLVQQVRILETMRPQDFLGFRNHLNPASGFQSVQFRELEFALGLKNPEIVAHLVAPPEQTQALRARLERLSVREALECLLVRKGLCATGDHEGRLRALVAVYERSEEFKDLNALCEVLIETDECLLLWRSHHILMVERMIGAKRGTGGSEGVGYLRTTLPKQAFPDLWQARTLLADQRP